VEDGCYFRRRDLAQDCPLGYRGGVALTVREKCTVTAICSLRREEHLSAPIAALCHVVRQTGNDNADKASHVVNLYAAATM